MGVAQPLRYQDIQLLPQHRSAAAENFFGGGIKQRHFAAHPPLRWHPSRIRRYRRPLLPCCGEIDRRTCASCLAVEQRNREQHDNAAQNLGY
jgi:hypothetical protein